MKGIHLTQVHLHIIKKMPFVFYLTNESDSAKKK
jgi:hypothetical protein